MDNLTSVYATTINFLSRFFQGVSLISVIKVDSSIDVNSEIYIKHAHTCTMASIPLPNCINDSTAFILDFTERVIVY